MDEVKKTASLHDVAFNYPGGNNALDKITLDFRAGEIVALIGANGSGKTTLLKLLAGYIEKSDGDLSLDGRPIEEYSNKQLNECVMLIEQNPEKQLTGPTVEDELARACRILGMQGRVIGEKVDSVLQLVRMRHAREWYLDELSCGERRRIALALALTADPKMLLLDEPLSDLDALGIRDTLSILRDLRKRGLCILISAHHMGDILEAADRIAVLGEGKLLACDETRKIIRNDIALKAAAVALPSIPRLFLKLQAEGILPEADIPLNLDQALAKLKQELGKRPARAPNR